jgi:hypothetical protein
MTMNTTATPRFPDDVIDHLADIAPGSALDQVRRHRSEARTQAQQSFAALFTPAEPVPGAVSLRERLALAAFTAGLHGEPRSAAFYARALAAEDAELAAAVASEVVRGRAQSLQAGSGPHGPYGRYPAGPLSREDQPGPSSSCPSWRPSCPSRSAWWRGCACWLHAPRPRQPINPPLCRPSHDRTEPIRAPGLHPGTARLAALDRSAG